MTKMKPRFEDNKIIFSFCGYEMMLVSAGEGVWRLRFADEKSLANTGAAQTLAKDLGEEANENICDITFEQSEKGFTAKDKSGSKAVFGGKALSFYSASGELKRRIKSISKGKDAVTVMLSAGRNERLYGTGERFDRVDRSGKRVHIYAIDRWCQTHGNSYIPIPFIISSNCSAVFMNRYEHSVIETRFLGRSKIKIRQKYAPADLYVFTLDSPEKILTAYSEITGFAPMPPEWSFGTLVCRYHPEFETKEGVFAMMQAMSDNDFPWDAVILEGFRTFKKENWPELREICDKVHDEGKCAMIYEQCGRFPADSEKYYGLDDSYAVNSHEGVYLHETRSMNLLDNFHHKQMRCIDLTSERCRDKWREFRSGLIDDIGIEGAKIDFCEQFPDSKSIKFADGRDPMAAHHWFPTLYNVLQYEHFNTRPRGGVNFSRGGGIGAQRYPFVWLGDQRREFYFLKPVIRGALSLGLSGVPFASWDMAGYQPSFNPVDKKYEEKVFIRALEFTAFSANIQTHGRVKRPYDFDEHTKAVYHAYSHLHDCLRPYLIEQAEVSCKTGLPLIRHLFLYDPLDKKAMDTEDEYMLGCGLLVAPVLTRKSKRNIYLPKGKWINIFDGKAYEGGNVIKNCRVPLEAVPVFRLEGADTEKLIPSLESAKEYIEAIKDLYGGAKE